MSRPLPAPDAMPRVIAPTTTKKFAQRMLSASRETACAMPHGFHAPTALDVLLTLHVAEDDARYLSAQELNLPGCPSQSVADRWLTALAAQGLIERRAELLALTQKGHVFVTGLIERIYNAQRALD